MSFYPKRNNDDDGETWLVSYADMMTLIACFFILMMAFANFDPVGFSIKAEQLSKAMRKEKYKDSEEKMSQILSEMVKHPEIMKKTKVSLRPGSLKIAFSSSVLFEEEEWKINPESQVVLDGVIDIIKIISDRFKIVVEGHSDIGEKGGVLNSPWILSSARASQVISRFEYFGFNPENLVNIGYGSSRRLVESVDEQGNKDESLAQQNRRVVIKVLKPDKRYKPVKLGLGIYFDDTQGDPIYEGNSPASEN